VDSFPAADRGSGGAGAYELAQRARSAGVSVPATDVVIAACARRHASEFETADSDFERLMAVPPIEIRLK